MKTRTMNLLQLQARINELVAENERRGWSDRNNVPVYVRIEADGKKEASWVPVSYVSNTLTGFSDNEGNRLDAMVVETREAEMIRPSRERTAKIKRNMLRRMLEGVEPVTTAGHGYTTVYFGRLKNAVAREFRDRLIAEGADSAKVRVPRKSATVYLWEVSEADAQALVDDFMAL